MISKKSITVYADTSVFGGVFDQEFQNASSAFFKAITHKKFQLVTSEVVAEEIQAGPDKVQALFTECLPLAKIAEVSIEALQLQQAYIDAEIITEKYATDALHVALATTNAVEIIVSWNFKHIVNFQKIPMYNAVNTLNGFGHVAIHSPLEVVEYED